MDVSILSILIAGMKQETAHEHLMHMDALSYVHMNEKDRRKQHRKWYKEAYPENFENKPLKTTDLELF